MVRVRAVVDPRRGRIGAPVSEIVDRLRARCEAGRGRGKVADFFLLDDIEWLLSEYAQTEADALELIAEQNARAGL